MKDENQNNESFQEWSDSLDAVVAAPEQHRVIFENERVRVLDTRIKPGETVPVHTHALPSLVCFLTVGDFIRYDAEGNVEIDSRTTGGLNVAPGEVMWLPPSQPHSAKNVGDGEIRGIAVELKD
jgi:quercetin dioxygenase-like cupin family protein